MNRYLETQALLLGIKNTIQVYRHKSCFHGLQRDITILQKDKFCYKFFISPIYLRNFLLIQGFVPYISYSKTYKSSCDCVHKRGSGTFLHRKHLRKNPHSSRVLQGDTSERPFTPLSDFDSDLLPCTNTIEQMFITNFQVPTLLFL